PTPATTPTCTLSLHDALPIFTREAHSAVIAASRAAVTPEHRRRVQETFLRTAASLGIVSVHENAAPGISSEEDLAGLIELGTRPDRKSTRLNSSHVKISYAVF